VSWFDAIAYTEWLSHKTGHTYRLPTSAEWEKAARAGTTTERYWGDDANQACAYANVHDETSKQAIPLMKWAHHKCKDGYVFTAPVGQFKPNAWGIYDVLGNVWEWTCSAVNKEQTSCESKSSNAPRVLRGGAWSYTTPNEVRFAYRSNHWLTNRTNLAGFRIARIF